jgi:hypothetical protein
MNLKESIRRILREEVKQLRDVLVPAHPKGVLRHRTTYKNRESIQKHGLLPKVGKYTSNYMSHNFPDSDPLPMVFASDPEYSFFGGDEWEIDLSKINNQWFHDPIHKDDGNDFKYYVTLDPIPPSALKLISSDEQKDDDMEVYQKTGKYPSNKTKYEEPKTPEEPNVFADMLNKLGNDSATISMDDLLGLKESIRRILNESKFFHRRIDLDEVKYLLPINADQVYYETESYEQFKYELTLRAVEAIIWNKYELGWEDLPSEEEIEFVTEVSNVFEDEIKELYNIYHNK